MEKLYDWPRAFRALQLLLTNPDDTQQVFVMIDALSGNSPRRLLKRFGRDENGSRLLAAKSNLLPLLCDRERLRALPPDSLGRAYLAFVESEGITAGGLVDASNVRESAEGIDPDLVFLRARLRDSHDLWHAVTGYKGDLVGEASLLAFSLAQTRNPAIALIVLAAFLRGEEFAIRTQIVRGFLRGARARWLVAYDWEGALARPLEDVRRELKVGPPPSYVPVRTSDLVSAAA
jgi:ubiquinone biosynthesis protein COQ4